MCSSDLPVADQEHKRPSARVVLSDRVTATEQSITELKHDCETRGDITQLAVKFQRNKSGEILKFLAEKQKEQLDNWKKTEAELAKAHEDNAALCKKVDEMEGEMKEIKKKLGI